MTQWNARSHEEQNLLNPAFCSTLLWHAGIGATENQNSPRSSLSYIEAFLILPLTLHQGTRQSLPIRVTTSLPVWVNDSPLTVASLPARARALVPHTKEALVFGGTGGLYQLDGDQLQANADRESSIRKMLRHTTEEVRECNNKARFLGRWFAHSGNPETIFTLLGIRP